MLFAAGTVVILAGVAKRNEGLKTFKTEDGWGYSISQKGKVIIQQPFIPAIGGRKSFDTRRDAAKTGRMVIKKLQHGQQPTLTIEELRKAGIIT